MKRKTSTFRQSTAACINIRGDSGDLLGGTSIAASQRVLLLSGLLNSGGPLIFGKAMAIFPKSPSERVGRMMYFPRMLDKIRLFARGELGADYHANLGKGFDKRCVDFLRVSYSELRDRVLEGGNDEEILEWCFKKGRPLSDDDIVIWNSFTSKFGWNDFATPALERLKQQNSIGNRTDIVTIADLIDLDEGQFAQQRNNQ